MTSNDESELPGQPGIAVIHLMKTGGTSIDFAARKHVPATQCFPSDIDTPLFAQKWQPERLLAMPDHERTQLRYVSVHMPAWAIAASVPHLVTATTLRDPVDRTVSHLRQLKRDRYPDWSLDRIWEHPPILERLKNYQSQMLAALAPEPQPRTDVDTSDLDDEARRRFTDEVQAIMLTGVHQVTEIDEQAHRRAIEQLSNTEIVGVTENLGSFARSIGSVLGFVVDGAGHANKTSDVSSVSNSLRTQIAHACSVDNDLYEIAVRRAAH